MIRISKEVEFDAGHRVPLHASKCRNPHGHRYRVRVTIEGELQTDGPEQGMLKDFGFLKQLLMDQVHDPLDHAFICADGDPLFEVLVNAGYQFGGWKVVRFPFVPTAENLARWSWHRLWPLIDREGFKLVEVAVWETPTSVAYVHGGVL